MATLEKAEGLLEELRGASYDAAVKDMDELNTFAAELVSLSGPAVPAAPFDPAAPLQFLNSLCYINGQLDSTVL